MRFSEWTRSEQAGGLPIGTEFDTDYERGCVSTTTIDDDGNFRGVASDGVEWVYNVIDVAATWLA